MDIKSKVLKAQPMGNGSIKITSQTDETLTEADLMNRKQQITFAQQGIKNQMAALKATYEANAAMLVECDSYLESLTTELPTID